jgi:hypothetical protein
MFLYLADFLKKINRDFTDNISPEYLKQVEHLLFADTLQIPPEINSEIDNNLLLTYFLRTLSRSLCGEYHDKLMYFLIGNQNSGKGLLTDALCACFGSYIGIFSANELKVTNNTANDRVYAWYYNILGCRIAIANELSQSGIKSQNLLDCGRIKPLVGGDMINTRLLYREINNIPASVNLWVMLNDVCELSTPNDSAFLGRVMVYEMMNSYTLLPDDPNLQQKMEANKFLRIQDTSLKQKVSTDIKFQNALFLLLARNYGPIMATPQYLLNKRRSWFLGIATAEDNESQLDALSEILEKYLEVTNNNEDYIVTDEVFEKLVKKERTFFANMSIEKFRSAFYTHYNSIKKVRKRIKLEDNGKDQVYCLPGLRFRKSLTNNNSNITIRRTSNDKQNEVQLNITSENTDLEKDFVSMFFQQNFDLD